MTFLPICSVVFALLGVGLCLVSPRRASAISATLLLGILLSSIYGIVMVDRFGPIEVVLGGWPKGVGISFLGDFFGFLLVGTAAALLLILVSFTEADLSDRLPMWLGLLAGFCGSVMTRDFFNLFVWFEVSLVSSFGLLRLELGAKGDTLRQYLTTQILASTAMLIGTGLFYASFGTLAMNPVTPPTSLGWTAVILLTLAMMVKSGIPPFHSWVIHSYRGLHKVSAIPLLVLSSKVGLIGLTRVYEFLPTVWPIALGTLAFYSSAILFQPISLRLRILILHTTGLAMLISTGSPFAWGLVHSLAVGALLLVISNRPRNSLDWIGLGIVASLPLTPGFASKIASISTLSQTLNWPLLAGLVSTSLATFAAVVLWASRKPKAASEPSPLAFALCLLTILLGVVSFSVLDMPPLMVPGGLR